ncbi:hypothetical protein Blue_223 [Bacillus phage Deep Blue]|uniref:Right handed beta helix domain-containing protein n=1 Tax=Bacillus phage Deep Blue TaxID=1792245 RepID=A0A140HM33_9CAUD|nr:tail spike protein [Bacillus phage Deep Blue]AMO26045.1 hypothetical protein Blue_223 [Bacillus phage Deep Blue]
MSREYFVELERWGIKQGSFGKPPYTNEQWEVAYNNALGLNSVLAYAKVLGSSIITVPRGLYSFCYTNLNGGKEAHEMQNTSINLFSNQTLDLNGSTFELMYDSINRNPYDKAPAANPVWKLSGVFIKMEECFNSHVVNGRIIGDIPNRSFTDTGAGFNSERGMEHTYGIAIDYGSSYCSVKTVDVSMFMGDGIKIGCYPVKDNWYVSQYDPVASPGYVDDTGAIVPKDGCYVSTKCMLKPEHHLLQMRTGWGYTRIPLIKNKHFEYVYFDATDKVISRKKAVYLQTVKTPTNASYLRVQFINENVGMTEYRQMWIISKPQAHHITIANCDIHDNHRGGISGGADFTTIEFNRIYHNGMDSGLGVPVFPDSTRYAINFEDSYSNKLVVENNLIFSGFNGVLIGTYHVEVRGNYISEFGGGGVVVYNNAYTLIEGNTLYNASLLGLMSSVTTQERNIIARDNTVYGGSTQIDATKYPKTHVKLLDNTFYVDTFGAHGDVEVRDNYFRSYSGSSVATYTGLGFNCTKFVNNTLEDYNYGTYYRIYVLKFKESAVVKGNTFNSVSFNYPYETNNLEFSDCSFYDSFLYTFSKDRDKPYAVTFNGCKLVNTNVDVGGIYINNKVHGGVEIVANFNKCTIEFTESGKHSNLVSVMDNVSTSELAALGVSPREYKINIKDSKITHSITSRNTTLIGGYEVIIPKNVNIENSDIEVKDITKFEFMKLTRDIGNFFKVYIKKSNKVGFSSFVKPKFYPITEYGEVLFGEEPPVGNFALNTPFFSTKLLKALWWNGSEWV